MPRLVTLTVSQVYRINHRAFLIAKCVAKRTWCECIPSDAIHAMNARRRVIPSIKNRRSVEACVLLGNPIEGKAYSPCTSSEAGLVISGDSIRRSYLARNILRGCKTGTRHAKVRTLRVLACRNRAIVPHSYTYEYR